MKKIWFLCVFFVVMTVLVINAEAANVVNNPGFETESVWDLYGGNGGGEYSTLQARTGSYSGKTYSWSGGWAEISQKVYDIVEGVTYTASVYLYNDSVVEPLYDGAIARICIDWFDSNGFRINETDLMSASLTAPNDSWELFSVSAVAPVGVSYAEVTLEQLDTLTGGDASATHFDDIYFGDLSEEYTGYLNCSGKAYLSNKNVVTNSDFETESVWDMYGGNGGGEYSTLQARTGSYSGKTYSYNGGWAEISQKVYDIVEGVTYTASVYLYNDSVVEPLYDGAIARICIDWFDSNGFRINETDLMSASLTAPNDSWELFSVSAVAPAGVSYAEVTLEQLDTLTGGDASATHFDDIYFGNPSEEYIVNLSCNGKALSVKQY